MDIQQIQETLNNLDCLANQVNVYPMQVNFMKIRKIQNELTQISMDIANEEPYLSSQIIETRDKLFTGNGVLCLGVAGRIVEILLILQQKIVLQKILCPWRTRRKRKYLLLKT